MILIYIFLIKELESQETTDNTRPATKAGKNPETSNPLTKVETTQTRKALIIRIKSPRVKILIGKVSTIRIGLTKAFKIPRTKATIRAM